MLGDLARGVSNLTMSQEMHENDETPCVEIEHRNLISEPMCMHKPNLGLLGKNFKFFTYSHQDHQVTFKSNHKKDGRFPITIGRIRSCVEPKCP